LPSLAVTVRRLHDTDRSGWFVLITLIRSSARSCCSWMCARHRGPEPLRSGSDPGCLSGAGRPGGRFRAGWAPARAGANTQTNAGAVIRSRWLGGCSARPARLRPSAIITQPPTAQPPTAHRPPPTAQPPAPASASASASASQPASAASRPANPRLPPSPPHFPASPARERVSRRRSSSPHPSPNPRRPPPAARPHPIPRNTPFHGFARPIGV
jgi:hypothetical protein